MTRDAEVIVNSVAGLLRASITSGQLPFPEIVGPIVDYINEQYSTDFKPLFDE